jgi:L-histidine Nalpha-methyltransferase
MTSIATPERAGDTRSRMLLEVREGLSRPVREIPPKYFYDQRGSRLFEEITRLPEYYLTRAEREILDTWMPSLMRRVRPASFVELGAGNGDKARVILDAMRDAGSARTYLPIDVSAEFLESAADDLRDAYPDIEIRPVAADMTVSLPIPVDIAHPALLALLGSTIGNFEDASAIRLLRRARAVMADDDRFLLGADLRKDVATVEAAYNDSRGVTAEFNRNVLHVLDRELGADFDPDAFAHRAVYVERTHRIEMHLVARTAQVVTIPDAGVFTIAAGEHILTEISCKYDRAGIEALGAASGLRIEEWRTDAEGRFALALLAPERRAHPTGCRR